MNEICYSVFTFCFSNQKTDLHIGALLNFFAPFLLNYNTEKVSLQQKTESWKQILLMCSANILENCCQQLMNDIAATVD